jgi:ubiquinone/menaquinone biosynthesis C-methylase UbiE
MNRNVDPDVAAGFGHEWSTFRQQEQQLTTGEREKIFHAYFRIFPWDALPPDGGTGIDVGCGSGRWSLMVAPRVGHLHLLDVSAEALDVARENLAGVKNVSFHLASADEIPLPPASLDFAFALGVLHHVPDTQAAIDAISQRLKPGAPFLIYLYYAFDNRPLWYRTLWKLSDPLRMIIARLPHPLRFALSQVIAGLLYWPAARLARLVEANGGSPNALPLSWYRDKSFYVMRTDAYDRFCTKLEKRFSRAQIEQMLARAGMQNIRFSSTEPYWCAVATRI